MFTDVTRVRQCLLNLLSNACKFTQRGTIRMDVAARPSRMATGCGFRIQDSGIGMSPDQVGRLFDAFTQADASTTPNMAGPDWVWRSPGNSAECWVATSPSRVSWIGARHS